MFPALAFAFGFGLALPGHLDVLAGRDPFVVDGTFVGGATSWGLVLGDGNAGGFERVCEEATGAPALLAHRLPDGRVLVATPDGMIESDDAGCSWSPVSSVLANLEVSALVVAQDAPNIVYLSTSRAGAPNGVWKSVDGGLSFEETALAGTIHPLVDLAVSDDGTIVAVTGVDLDTDAPLLRVSTDGGASFAAPTFAVDETTTGIVGVRVLAVDGNAPEARIWLTVFSADDPALMTADVALTSLRLEGTFETDAVALVRFQGAHYALVRPGALYRRAATSSPDAAWSAIDGIVPSCLKRVAGDARLWACTVAPAQFAASSDGATFEPVLREIDVENRACPEDTFAAQACVYAIDPPQPVDDIGSPGFADALPFDRDENDADADDDDDNDNSEEPSTIDAPSDDDDNNDVAGCTSTRTNVNVMLSMLSVALLVAMRRRR